MSDTSPTADEPSPAFTSAQRRVSPWWRALAIFLLLALLIAGAAGMSMFEQFKVQIHHLQGKVAEVPQVRHMAVLLDDPQQPAMLVTYEPRDAALQVQRLNAVREGREESMQLWALVADQPPRSLGVLTSKHPTSQLPAAPAVLDGVSQLAISVEDKGGVPSTQGPRQPYLFKGWLVRKAL